MEHAPATALPGSKPAEEGDEALANTDLAKPPPLSVGAANNTTAKLSKTPDRKAWGLAALSCLLLILAFPDFNLWPLAWVALVPLLVLLPLKPTTRRAFLLGLVVGTAFFYGTCYWLTYSMIHYAGIPTWLAYLLLIPGALLLGLFPASFAAAQTRLVRTWGTKALFAAPFLWVALEWMRLHVTGQLWNAIGYSQAFHPALIQVARWGGVYAVGFLIVTVNASIAFAVVHRTLRTLAFSFVVTALVVGVVLMSNIERANAKATASISKPEVVVVAVQPNVPMDLVKTKAEIEELIERHIALSTEGLSRWRQDGASDNTEGSTLSGVGAKADSIEGRKVIPVLVVWPESPMNFAYGEDSQLRDSLSRFTEQNHTSLLFNSQESAPDNGWYNSGLMVNEAGRLVAQYDKIRLMPFGEYVPLPRWLPGSERVRGIVGGFTPGVRYSLMPVGTMRAGVFICIESAYPWIARTFTAEGANVLINISNDGYLGRTAVMKQHLANTIFRAVENGRPLLRVTNTGISAFITPSGEMRDPTSGFQSAVRTWTISSEANRETFYTKHGDWFVAACAAMSLLIIVLSSITLRGKTWS
jgi:apolipoprotein N-acyltransferase